MRQSVHGELGPGRGIGRGWIGSARARVRGQEVLSVVVNMMWLVGGGEDCVLCLI